MIENTDLISRIDDLLFDIEKNIDKVKIHGNFLTYKDIRIGVDFNEVKIEIDGEKIRYESKKPREIFNKVRYYNDNKKAMSIIEKINLKKIPFYSDRKENAKNGLSKVDRRSGMLSK